PRMRLVNPKASTFLAIFEIFCSACECVNAGIWHRGPIGRITRFSAKFTDAPSRRGLARRPGGSSWTRHNYGGAIILTGGIICDITEPVEKIREAATNGDGSQTRMAILRKNQISLGRNLFRPRRQAPH